MDIRREDNAQEIYRRFLAPGAEESVEIINDDIVEQCKERLHEGSKDVFAACTAVVRGYLAGEPFKEFENSLYFHRYLQWKWLERYYTLCCPILSISIHNLLSLSTANRWRIKLSECIAFWVKEALARCAPARCGPRVKCTPVRNWRRRG